jgi:hypothetical protein
MRHRNFNILAITSLFLIVIVGGFYNYVLLFHRIRCVLIALKPLPMIILIINTLLYFFMYRVNLYALIMLIAFYFCLAGDIILILPTQSTITLILGGLSFAIARGVMIIGLIIYPLKVSKKVCVKAKFKKIIILELSICGSFLGLGLYLCSGVGSNVMTLFVLLYSTLMGIHAFFSAYRIGEIRSEPWRPQILTLVGTLLFCVSDSVLIFNMLIHKIPYGDVISISIYWASMYILMLSIIRTQDKNLERDGVFEGYNII